THPSATLLLAEARFSCDLHVLGLPLTFALSQDQTLQLKLRAFNDRPGSHPKVDPNSQFMTAVPSGQIAGPAFGPTIELLSHHPSIQFSETDLLLTALAASCFRPSRGEGF